jgi:outer membrane protein OmpA-like peptidoglycan-associated protein
MSDLKHMTTSGAAICKKKRNVNKPIKLGGCLILVALAAACATPLPPTQSGRGPGLPDAGPSGEYKVKFPDQGRGKARYVVLTLGESVTVNCGELKAQHFEFDSSQPLPQDELLLQGLAECLNRPTNVEHDLMLTGSTDDRGSPAYNQALGLRRAERVKAILVKGGVSRLRIQTSSGGESGALAEDPRYSYGYDRRVDITLLGVVHAPR